MGAVSQIVGHVPARGRRTTAERAIDVLLLFDEQCPVLSAAEMSRRLGVPRSTIYRYLQSLRSSGLVEEDDAGRGFRLGPRVFHLARIARKGLGLSELALPIMRALAARTGEAVLLTRRSGDQVVCVERIESRHPIRISYERGHVLPVHAGASAKVLLAFLSPAEIEATLAVTTLQRYTARTVIDRAALLEQLGAIRAAGYAVTNGEVDEGVRGVAAPILNRAGQVVAGLSVAGPAYRLDDAALPDVVEAVRSAAEALSERLRDLEA